MASYSLVLDSFNKNDSSDFTVSYSSPINLNGLQYKRGLTRLNTYYSWYNGVIDKVLTLDDGLYSLENLIDEIHDLMILQGDYTLDVNGNPVFDINWELDLSSGYVTQLLTNSFSVDWSNRNMRILFSFNSANYIASSVSESKADINYGVNTILLHRLRSVLRQ